ncbi:DUF2808 domain-containing protein [Myxosarcina sp. GI1(2024)]
MKKFFLLGLLSSMLTLEAIAIPDAVAVRSPDGTVSFEQSPRLLDAYTTFNGIRVRQAVYYFDIELPEDIGEPLKKIVIQQRQGAEEIKFRIDRTKAFLGTHDNKIEQLAISATQNEETQAITITLNKPVPPGNTVTIGLKPRRNPDFGGVYLFGVTVFPMGKRANSLYLGAGRLSFYQPGGHHLF